MLYPSTKPELTAIIEQWKSEGLELSWIQRDDFQCDRGYGCAMLISGQVPERLLCLPAFDREMAEQFAAEFDIPEHH